MIKILERNLTANEIESLLNEHTIFDKIEFSGISRNAIREKIQDLRYRQVPQRTVLTEHDDESIVNLWFKNWLHPMLKHCVEKSPSDKRGCSARVIRNDNKRDLLRMYENAQFNFKYEVKDIEIWLDSFEKCDCGNPVDPDYAPCCCYRCWSEKFEN